VIRLCGWGGWDVKAGWLILFVDKLWIADKTMQFLVSTCFRDEQEFISFLINNFFRTFQGRASKRQS